MAVSQRLSARRSTGAGMQSLEGVVTIVQEGRFQVVDSNGVAHFFVLAYSAAADPEQLTALQRAQARVRVSYKPARDLIGHLAQKIVLLETA